MNKESKIIKYYVLCNKLKNVIRTGWTNWNIQRDRVESVAEHIYGVQMLAIAMNSEYEYEIDIQKVIYMLAIHELEEIYIGDIPWNETIKKDKKKLGEQAVEKVVGDLLNKKEIKDLINEFDEKKTKEALFAYYCDKLECDIQCKIYDEERCVDINNQNNNPALKNNRMKNLLSEEKSWHRAWIKFDEERCNFDRNFQDILDYVKNNQITE